MKTMMLMGLLLILLATTSPALAEGGTCPNGYYPIGGQGTSGCAPIPGYNQQRQQPLAPQIPSPQWQSRFGAIATDAPHGVLGTATGKGSQFEAELEAMKNCEKNGGTQCQRAYWYSNSCVAITVDDQGGLLIRGRPTMDQAIQASMDACKKDGSTGCTAYYQDCSPAVQAQ